MSAKPDTIELDLPRLTAGYRNSAFTPSIVIETIFDRIAARGDDGVWISLVGGDAALARARFLEGLPAAERAGLPLWGVPFSVKDCIDVVGQPTTSACPDYSYVAGESSPSVERLLAAGAILVGKTNMDQFATGVVGVRSPYGVARNAFNPEYIPGGSSSGAAVSVAAGLVSLALGTDTGGSGRVPAAFNNVVGLKPTRGLISRIGTVSACRSIETISVFALTVHDAQVAFDVIRDYDRRDPFSRDVPLAPLSKPTGQFRFGVPERLDFFGDVEAGRLFDRAVRRLEALGGVSVNIDFAPFLEINDMLFRGPWLAERYGVLKEFLDGHGTSVLPVTRDILLGGARITGTDVFAGQQRLNLLKREIDDLWHDIDVLVVPTTGTIYKIAELEADPVTLNTRIGTYTTFVNLADLSAVAVPSGFLPNGLPQGVTLIGPAFADNNVARLADRFHRSGDLPLGARTVRHLEKSQNPEARTELVT